MNTEIDVCSQVKESYESLKNVAEIINEYCDEIVFNNELNKYETPCYTTWIPEYLYELNFGWYVFQEQQKQIDKALQLLNEQHNAASIGFIKKAMNEILKGKENEH